MIGLKPIQKLALAAVKRHARASIRVAAIALWVPLAAHAEPVRLKLAFFASEQIEAYQYGVKPFVDAINSEEAGLVAVDVYPDGALGQSLAEQPRLVLNGTADIAFMIPGQTPYLFPDNVLFELPGRFRDTREGTLAFSRLIAAKALHGYQDFLVLGAYVTGPTGVHSRRPVARLADLRGQKIRVNNATEAELLERLGAIPTVMSAAKMAEAVDGRAVDAAVVAPVGMFEFGVSRVVTNHYLLDLGGVPLVVAMNLKKFEALPEAAQALIRKYAGGWTAATWIASYGAAERQSIENIKADPVRRVVAPSAADIEAARAIYRSLTESWVARSPHNRELVEKVDTELATIRLGTR